MKTLLALMVDIAGQDISTSESSKTRRTDTSMQQRCVRCMGKPKEVKQNNFASGKFIINVSLSLYLQV